MDQDESSSSVDDEAKLENDNKAAVAETLQHDGKRNNRVSLLFIGQDGAGKTSLKKSLLGEKAEKDQASTIGIEYEVIEVKENDKSKPWKRAADGQFLASKQYTDDIIAKVTARRKYDSQTNLKEAKDGRRGRDGDGREYEVGGGGGEIGSDEGEPEGGGGRLAYEVGGGEIGSDESEPEGRGCACAYDVNGGGEVEGAARTQPGSHKDEREKNVEKKRKTQRQFEYQVSDEQMEEAIKNVENYHEDTMDTIRFLVGDVAGQSVFYDVHLMMLRLRTVFIFVVDLTKSLNDIAQPMFVEKETKKTLENPLQETNLDYLTRWVAALRNLNPCDNETKTSTVESVDQPKTIIVYSKPDELSDSEVETKKTEVRRVVDEQLRRVGCDSLIVREFVINNMGPRSPEESRELENLRATIFETAQEVLKKQEISPVNWLVFERLLDAKKREATRRDCPYIDFDEARQLGKQCNVEETFNDALKFFHEENIVVHFQGDPPISDLVVLDPAWLVELFTEVISVSKNSSWPPAKSCAWDDLREKGKLNFDKLPTVLDNHRGSRDALKEMMVRAGLICHWEGNVYLVPSMVKKSMEKKRICEAFLKCLKPSLFLYFEDESIPLGFYTRFQVELLKWAHGDDSKCELEELQLYCNFMRVVKTENGSTYFVFLARHVSRIEFAILVDGRIIEWTDIDIDIARKVLSDLDGIIKRIQSTHPNFKGMRYKFGLNCDLCRQETDDPCERHQKKRCSNGDCVHIWSLDELKKPLISCKKNQAGTNTSKLHKMPWVEATEPPSEPMWIETSKTHREKFQKLLEYGQKRPEEMKNINGVRVCFQPEFRVDKGSDDDKKHPEEMKNINGVDKGSDDTGVYIGLAKDGYERAVKCVLKKESENFGPNEKDILNTTNAVNSRHVVNYRYYDEESNDHVAYLVLDLHEETLTQYVERENQEILTANTPVITRQILKGLDDLHNPQLASTFSHMPGYEADPKHKTILHRDLKPSNILRNVQGDWLLADFGISRTLPDGQTTRKSNERGTKHWRAVESYDGGKYMKQSDIQAAGMVCFYILTKGRHPFGPEDKRLQNFLNGKPVGLDKLTDPVAKDFISWMLQHNHKDRPYADKALKHPYLQPPEQQFELLERVGNQEEIKKGNSSCDVVKEINIDPLLFLSTWKSQIPPDVLAYLCSDGTRSIAYGDEWTECLRLIRNKSQHWNDVPRPRPKVHHDIGEPQDYFLKAFPTLSVVVHRVIRSKEDWKKRKDLENLF